MREIRRKEPMRIKEIFPQTEPEPKSPYKKGDCCYGCPYVLCPSRPEKPYEMERPKDCVWSMYQRI